MLEGQNKLHPRKEEQDSLKKSGLTLKGVAQDAEGIPEAVRKELSELHGIKKLKFVKMKTLRALTDEAAAKTDFSLVRWISTLSTQTNMKYMNIGDSGLHRINEQLHGCRFVTTIILSAARVTSDSVCGLIKIVHSIGALTYLDLSSNAICDTGGAAIAEAFKSCLQPQMAHSPQPQPQHSNITMQSLEAAAHSRISLKTLCLQGNRLTAFSIEKLIATVCHRDGSISYMSLANNRMRSKTERFALQAKVDAYNSWALAEDDKAQKAIAADVARIDKNWDDLTKKQIRRNLAALDNAATSPMDNTPNEILTAANRRKLLSRNATSFLGPLRSASPIPMKRAPSAVNISLPETNAESDQVRVRRKKPAYPVFVSVAKTVIL